MLNTIEYNRIQFCGTIYNCAFKIKINNIIIIIICVTALILENTKINGNRLSAFMFKCIT